MNNGNSISVLLNPSKCSLAQLYTYQSESFENICLERKKKKGFFKIIWIENKNSAGGMEY